METSFAVSVLAASLLTGCAVGPDYHRPAVQTPPAFRAPTAQLTPEAASLADLKWWEVFKDENLQQLIKTALVENYDLRDAVARVAAARANLGVTRSEQFPNLGAGGSLTTTRLSRDGQLPLPKSFVPSQNRTFGEATLHLLSLELDIWGRLRRATEAARANLLGAEENRKAVVTTLVSDVATSYFSLRELDYKLEGSKETLGTRQESLRLIQTRQGGGVATLLDRRQDLPPEVPTGLPSTLLERRPDIRAAEENLIAANAEIGVAKAAYFSQISLTGFLGGQSTQLSNLFSAPSRGWTVTPQVTQPIFTAGRLRSNVKLTEAERQSALIRYEKAIQTAFTDVSNALIAHQRVRESRVQQELLVTALADRKRLAHVRYRGGVDTLLNALDADRDLFQAQLALSQIRLNEVLSVVQLYRQTPHDSALTNKRRFLGMQFTNDPIYAASRGSPMCPSIRRDVSFWKLRERRLGSLLAGASGLVGQTKEEESR